ncbi:MAG: rhomboid family intramembrane serine protease, partial [Myxococcota bacterium]|nr:rhomboid family intramembrane serine protease [Myxococcota bacterium]
GDNVEDRLGPVKFVGIYLAWGLAAAAAQMMFGGSPEVPMVGASGAIAGVLGAYAVLYPQARVHTLVFLFIFVTRFTLPAVLLLAFWFAFQFFNMGEAGVAWWAHIGGFVAGLGVGLPLRLNGSRAR